jgi:hypothetical protein
MVDITLRDNVSVSDAAKYLDMYPQALRNALQQKRAPFGFAALGAGGRWTYYISGPALEHFKKYGAVMYGEEESA